MKIALCSILSILCSLTGLSQESKQGNTEERKFTISFAYEKECGSPFGESQIYTHRTGHIIRINNEKSVTFLQDTADGNPAKKEFVVLLAGVNARGNKKNVRALLTKYLLNQDVEISGNVRRSSDNKFEGRIFLMNESLPEIDWIAEYLIENGLAKYSEPSYSYGVSDYSLCVCRQLQEKAKREKLGIWAEAVN